jgi:hypothetical protein
MKKSHILEDRKKLGVGVGVWEGETNTKVIYKNWRVMTVNKPSIFPVFFLMPLQRGGPQQSFVLLAVVRLMKMDSPQRGENRSE